MSVLYCIGKDLKSRLSCPRSLKVIFVGTPGWLLLLGEEQVVLEHTLACLWGNTRAVQSSLTVLGTLSPSGVGV